MPKQTYASRYIRVGNSQCIIVPKDVREALGFRPGDLVVMRMFGKVLIARRLAPEDVVEVDSIPADALPSAVRT